MRRWLAALVAVAACQSGGGGAPAAPPAPLDAEEEPELPVADGDGGTIGELPTEQGTPTEEPDEDDAIEDLGAIAAWQAVIDRDQFLARRDQHGVVSGRVGPPVAPTGVVTDAGPPPPTGLTWLIDDTEGNGALAIRVRFPGVSPQEGERVAVGGAWTLDDTRHWLWAADGVTPLPASEAAAPKDPPAPPGLASAVGEPPGKTTTPDKVARGELMEFAVKKRPLRVGDGWAITSERGSPLMAYLLLPGERSSYGGHDLRTADEKWSLKVGPRYWVRVGKIRPARGDDPPIIRAVTRPVRFP